MSLEPGAEVTKKAMSYWSIRHDQIALLVGIGMMTNEAIARQFGINKGTVGDIARDPRGQAVIEATRQRLRERLVDGVEAELTLATQLAVRAVKKTLEAAIDAKHPAKANQDRVAIKLLQGKGFLKTDVSNPNAGFSMAPDQFDKLMKAFERSDRAKEIDPFEGVVDGVFTIEQGDQPDLFDDEAEEIEPLHVALGSRAGPSGTAGKPGGVVVNANQSGEDRPEDRGPQDMEDAARGLTPELKKEARIIVDDWLKEQYRIATGT